MQKLTKEQAQWLIEQFNIAHGVLMTKPADGMFHILDCRNIINHCTEKEFPEFTAQCMNEDSINIRHFSDETSPVWMFCGLDKNVDKFFNKEQFKQFTQGCNEIVKWLEEQE